MSVCSTWKAAGRMRRACRVTRRSPVPTGPLWSPLPPLVGPHSEVLGWASVGSGQSGRGLGGAALLQTDCPARVDGRRGCSQRSVQHVLTARAAGLAPLPLRVKGDSNRKGQWKSRGRARVSCCAPPPVRQLQVS